MVLGIQFIGLIFVAAMLYLNFLFYKRNNYTRAAFSVWTAAWLCAALLLIFPETFSKVTQTLKFARTTDFYVAIAIMFFGAITFLNYAKVQKQERKVEELVRGIAGRRRK